MNTRNTIATLVVLTFLVGAAGCANMPPVGGVLMSDCNMPAVWSMASPVSTSDFSNGPAYERVGRASGEASSTSIMGLFWFGDSGGGTAYQNALAKVGADALMNPRLDMKCFGVLGLFATFTTTVEGEAIRFKK